MKKIIFTGTFCALLVSMFFFSCSSHQTQEKETTDGDLSFFDQDASENREHPDVDDTITDDGNAGMFHCDENGLCIAPSGWLFVNSAGELAPSIYAITGMVLPLVQVDEAAMEYKYLDQLPLTFTPKVRQELLYPIFKEKEELFLFQEENNPLELMGITVEQIGVDTYLVTNKLRTQVALLIPDGIIIIRERDGYGVSLDFSSETLVDLELGQFTPTSDTYTISQGIVEVIRGMVKQMTACQLIGMLDMLINSDHAVIMKRGMEEGGTHVLSAYALVSFLDTASLLTTMLSAIPGGNSVQACVTGCLNETIQAGIECVADVVVQNTDTEKDPQKIADTSRGCLLELLLGDVCTTACGQNALHKGILEDAAKFLAGAGELIAAVDIIDTAVDACYGAIFPMYGEFSIPLTDEYSDSSVAPDEDQTVDDDATIPDTEDTTPTCEEQCSSAGAECGRIGSCTCGSCDDGYFCNSDKECEKEEPESEPSCDPSRVYQHDLGHNILICSKDGGYVVDLGKISFRQEIFYLDDACSGVPQVDQVSIGFQNKRTGRLAYINMSHTANEYWLDAKKYNLYNPDIVSGDQYNVIIKARWDGLPEKNFGIQAILLTASDGNCQ